MMRIETTCRIVTPLLDTCLRWTEGRITNLPCHMLKEGRFMTDEVPHRWHGVVASECQVWEWDQTPALGCTPYLVNAGELAADGSVIGDQHGILCLLYLAVVAETSPKYKVAHIPKKWVQRHKRETKKQRDKGNPTRESHYDKKEHLFFLSFYFFCSQEPWFTHRWHHGYHSYFYWLVNGQLFSLQCHLSNPQQSTSPWEKKVKHPKMIESWKEEYDTCMPCYCPMHVSQVKCLVTATGLLCLYYSLVFIHLQLLTQCWNSTLLHTICFLSVLYNHTIYILTFHMKYPSVDHHVLHPCSPPQGFRVCECVFVWLQGWGYSWPSVMCS